ncbi:MAG: hypothetical protein K6F84_08800 [Lachnospiraceae bacterium]|nr:hypothetical protein [Lachnospiraceae bacterium]
MGSNNLSGVYKTAKKNGTVYYRAGITFKNKHISLGSFDDENSAHAAYLEASHVLKDDKCTILKYNKDTILPYGKWVSLINFRDTGIYFQTPIVLGRSYFNYHLSQDTVLKFDMEDLFYYSKHKIMKRGNHYFVADYGMQVNIANRYGIKNWAVIDKDYCFINGDTTDFRRENIEVFNIYQGVSKITSQKGNTLYVAKIHLKGNYVIGYYESAKEAAIAYNKAIDIFKSKGINKNYRPNYLEDMSPRQYADIYSQCKISDSVLNASIAVDNP